MNEQIIWNFLYSKISNPYGTAALIGNLDVESKLNPRNLQGTYSKRLKMSSDEYTDAVDNGTYTSFVNDGAGYGLAQWTHWSRKEALLNFAKESKASIGDLNMQLVFLWKELQSYKTCLAALKAANSVKEASDVIVVRYEKPKDQSEKARQNRANYGMKYFNMFAGNKNGKSVIISVDNVNIRSGNGKDYSRIVQVDAGMSYDWIATAENGWHAVKLADRIGWVSGEFSKIK